MTSAFDALELNTDKPEKLELRHPSTGAPLVCNETGEKAFVEVYSTDSDIARKVIRSAQSEVFKRRGKVTAETSEANATNLLVAITKDWFLVDFEGNRIDVPCNEKNARDLYTNSALAWIKDQVDEYAGDRANFTPTSKTKSLDGQNTSSVSK